jgi:ankyrin repeat protein
MGTKMLKRATVAVLALAIAIPAWAGAAEDKALWDDAVSHNLERVQADLRRGADPNASKTRRSTPLEAAAMGTWHSSRDRAKDLANNETAVRLSQAGFSDDEIDRYLAFEITKLLFAAGAKIGRYDKALLFFPIAKGNVELVGLLINEGASVSSDLEGYTAPELAKKYGQDAVYQLLVSRGGIPVDSRSSAQLAFVHAAEYRDIEGMARALKDGARINDLANKQTALIEAVKLQTYKQSEAEAIWWLLDHGADPNRKNESGDLPLHMFVVASKYTIEQPTSKPLAEETLTRLLKVGAKVSGMDSTGRSPLHVAAEVDNIWMAEVLIKQGAKLMARDNTGKTPLDLAESAPMIKLLKQAGATER